MTEEEPTLDELRQLGENTPFVYRPIDSDSEYSRERFLASKEQFNDITEYKKVVDEKPYHLSTRKKLAHILFGDKQFHVGKSPEFIQGMAKYAHDSGRDRMAGYVEHNLESFLDILDGDSYLSLALSVPLCRTDDSEHNKLIDIVNDYKEYSKIAEEGKISKMREKVLKKIKSSSVPDWGKQLLNDFANDSSFVQEVFQRAYAAKRQVFELAFTKADGEERKVNENRVKTLVLNSLREIKKDFDDEVDSGAKNDIWEGNIRDYYLALADLAYPLEKKKFEDRGEETQAEIDKRLRYELRRKKGMAA